MLNYASELFWDLLYPLTAPHSYQNISPKELQARLYRYHLTHQLNIINKQFLAISKYFCKSIEWWLL